MLTVFLTLDVAPEHPAYHLQKYFLPYENEKTEFTSKQEGDYFSVSFQSFRMPMEKNKNRKKSNNMDDWQ